jgi:hypothetical protein
MYLHAVLQPQLNGAPKRPPSRVHKVNLHMLRNHWAAGRLLNPSNQVTPPPPHIITLKHRAISLHSIKMRTAAIRLGSLLSHFQPQRPLLPISFTKFQTPIPILKTKRRKFSTMAPISAEPEEFEYIVIGGGSGGSGTARRAAGWYGKKTLLIENGLSGGCCVNVG